VFVVKNLPAMREGYKQKSQRKNPSLANMVVYYQELGFRAFFLDNYFSFVVKFSFMPVSTVEKVRLSGCRTS
jgi:hypothetical protein